MLSCARSWDAGARWPPRVAPGRPDRNRPRRQPSQRRMRARGRRAGASSLSGPSSPGKWPWCKRRSRARSSAPASSDWASLCSLAGSAPERQEFNRASIGLLSNLLFLVVIALLLPARSTPTSAPSATADVVGLTDEQLSLAASVVLLLIYIANLIYTLITHRDVFAAEQVTCTGEVELAPLSRF